MDYYKIFLMDTDFTNIVTVPVNCGTWCFAHGMAPWVNNEILIASYHTTAAHIAGISLTPTPSYTTVQDCNLGHSALRIAADLNSGDFVVSAMSPSKVDHPAQNLNTVLML